MHAALPYAVGVAVSPIPIAATLLLLTCRRALANGVSFLAGWVAGVALLAVLFVLLVTESGLTDSDPMWIAVAELALGVAFVAAAAVLWSRRDRRGARAAWIGRVDDLTTARSAGLGVVLSGANPKVVGLALGAALALARAEADTTTATQAVVVFTLVGALGVLAPLAVYAATPKRAEPVLGELRSWLDRHEARVLVALGLLIGALFLGDAASGL